MCCAQIGYHLPPVHIKGDADASCVKALRRSSSGTYLYGGREFSFDRTANVVKTIEDDHGELGKKSNNVNTFYTERS